MLWKVLSEFPGEDQSAPPLRCGDITDFVIIRSQLHIIKHVVKFNYCTLKLINFYLKRRLCHKLFAVFLHPHKGDSQYHREEVTLHHWLPPQPPNKDWNEDIV